MLVSASRRTARDAPGVLVVDGLLRDPDRVGDVGPRPTELPGVLHLEVLQGLGQATRAATERRPTAGSALVPQSIRVLGPVMASAHVDGLDASPRVAMRRCSRTMTL